MAPDAARSTGQLAIAIAVIAVASLVSLVVFFIVGNPFGTLNDIGNGTVGALSAILAWRLRAAAPGSSAWPVLVAVLGGAVTVVGSALVISQATGFLLAGLVSSVGFALIGVWLITHARRVGSAPGAAPALGAPRLGMLAGALMVVGLVSLPGILLGIDDMATAPAWIWIGFVGWLGAFVLYPLWCYRLWRSTASA